MLIMICGCAVNSDDEPDFERIPGANGIYYPENCIEQGNAIELLGHLDLEYPLTDIWGYYDVEQDREYALTGFQSGEETEGGLYIIEVTNPESPTMVATVEGIEAHDVSTWKHLAYTVTGHTDDGDVGVVYDLTDPASPVKTGEFESGHNLFISDRGFLYKTMPGVNIYDLSSNPAIPEFIWSDKRGNGHGVSVINDTLYDFHGFDGTFMYDVSDPFEPEYIAQFDNESVRYHHSGWVSADGNYLYINDELPRNLSQNNDISIWNTGNRRMVGSYRDETSTVHNSFERCDRLIVSYYVSGLRLFDISDPEEMVLLDEYDTETEVQEEGWFLGAWGVFPYTKSGNILVSDVNNGLYVFRLQ